MGVSSFLTDADKTFRMRKTCLTQYYSDTEQGVGPKTRAPGV